MVMTVPPPGGLSAIFPAVGPASAAALTRRSGPRRHRHVTPGGAASMLAFKEVVDLSHELFNNMPGVSETSTAVFFPVDTHDRSTTRSQGQISMESKMLLL